MKNKLVITAFFSILFLGNQLLYAQQPPMKIDSATLTKDENKEGEMEEEIPHPFFTHMGMPEAKGSYSLRLTALGTKGLEGKTNGDFAFHFETGLSKTIGLHIRNDRFLQNPATEIMFQFAVLTSKNGMNGIAALIEFEMPTSKDAKRINTLVGFSSTLGSSRVAFNQVVHYNPREDMVDGSVALVLAASKKIFFVAELLGYRMPDGTVVLNPLAGIKVRLNKNIIIGVGYQRAVTNMKDYKSQSFFQPDLSW